MRGLAAGHYVITIGGSRGKGMADARSGVDFSEAAVLSSRRVGARGDPNGEDQMLGDSSRDRDDPHGPEDRTIFDLTCPRCGARIPLANQAPLDRVPSRESVACPACGEDVRLITDPTVA